MPILFSTFSIILTVALWLYMRRKLVINDFDLVDLMLFVFFLTFVFRSAVLVARLDEPWFSNHVRVNDLDQTVAVALFVVIVWMVLLAIGIKAGQNLGARPWMTTATSAFTVKQMNFAALVLFILGSILIVPDILAFGGIAGLAAENKLGEGTQQVFRYPALIGSIWAVASIVSIRRKGFVRSISESISKWDIAFAAALFVGNATLAFSYGARDAFIFGFVAISLSVVSVKSFSAKNLVKIIFIGVLILTVASSFRFLRDSMIMQDVVVFDDGTGIVRKVSLTANLTKFDSLMVAIKDFPNPYNYYGALPFVEGLRTIPAAKFVLGPDDENFDNVAREVLRLYIPWRKNGNPITAIGDWYVSFGQWGILFGGLLSGFAIGWLQIKMSFFKLQPIVFVISVFLAARYIPFGISANTVTIGVRFFIPLILSIYGMYFIRRFNQKT